LHILRDIPCKSLPGSDNEVHVVRIEQGGEDPEKQESRQFRSRLKYSPLTLVLVESMMPMRSSRLLWSWGRPFVKESEDDLPVDRLLLLLTFPFFGRERFPRTLGPCPILA
jgi:hypothetical protein